MNPRRILISMWSFGGGGAERVAVVLANALARQGCDVRIVAGLPEGPNLALLDAGIPVSAPAAKGHVAFVSHLSREIGAWRPEIVLSHQLSRNVLAILAHRSAAGRDRRAVVCVEHNEPQRTRALKHLKLRNRAAYWLARLVFPRADCIVAISEGVQSGLKRFLFPLRARIRVVPNAVVFPELLDWSRQSPPHPWLTERERPVIVTAGRLTEQKNHRLLIEAFKTVADRTTARLIIFGEGELRETLAQQVRELGLSSRVSLPGYVDNPFAAFRAAALFVLSSRFEGLPTVAIEALACGTPVISTDNSAGIRSIVSTAHLGLIVPEGDGAALAAAMVAGLERAWDDATLAAATSSYAADSIAALYMRVFDEVLAGKSGRRMA